MSVHRTVRALLGVCLLLGIGAAPTAAGAGSRTWYVAPEGASGGRCGSPDFHSIQDAIDSADRNDIIVVCRGSYAEALRVQGSGKDGLTIRARRPLTAKVLPPRSGSGLSSLLSIAGADRVRIRDLVLAARGTAPCQPVTTMLRVTGSSSGVVIRGNRIRVNGASSAFGGPCGYRNGIVQDGTAGRILIRHNVVDDSDGDGYAILARGAAPTIVRNSIHSRRLDQDGTQVGFVGYGIVVDGATDAVVQGNHVLGAPSAVRFGAGTPMLEAGIWVTESNGALVKRNLVEYTGYGVLVSVASGPRILDNTVRSVWTTGFRLADLASAVFRRNMATDSGAHDCHGTSLTDLHSSGNIGALSDPAGLCQPA